MIAELEKAWEKRSKGEADLSDVYKRFSYATQSCRQVVTKRLTIITSLVEYYEQWQLVSGELYLECLISQYACQKQFRIYSYSSTAFNLKILSNKIVNILSE